MVNFSFHPFEIAFCGHSGVGKTTLITKLIRELASEFSIGYIKRDAHRFEMDKEGKDTFKARESGATKVYISDSSHSACISSGAQDFIQQKMQMLECDFVFIEGWKNSPLPKIIFIDDQRSILQQVNNGTLNHIMAFIGKEATMDKLPGHIPYFQRDEIHKILSFVRKTLSDWTKGIPLYGLVLAGGYSKRMQRDKALINYRGKVQAEYCFDLLSSVTERAFLSVRKEQWAPEVLPDLPKIYDRFLDLGPLSGLLSAMSIHPNVAWMVIACDLPHLRRETLLELRHQRNPTKIATVYENDARESLEPLCAIYEPKSYLRFMSFLSLGIYCPTKMISLSSIKRIKLATPLEVENINTPEEYASAMKHMELRGFLQTQMLGVSAK